MKNKGFLSILVLTFLVVFIFSLCSCGRLPIEENTDTESNTSADTKKRVTITFDPNGGEIVNGKDEVETTEGVKFIAVPEVEREGYDFVCWTTEDGEEIEVPFVVPDEDTTYFAYWKKHPVESNTDFDDTNSDVDVDTETDADAETDTETDTDTEPPHRHMFADEWSFDEYGHWYASICGCKEVTSNYSAHIDNGKDGFCDKCKYQVCEHPFEADWTTDKENHWKNPTCGCQVVAEKGKHVDESKDGKCDICEYALYANKYQYDMDEYIVLPDYKNETIDLKLDSIQAAIDSYLMNCATEYVVVRGDNIYLDISVYEERIVIGEGGEEFALMGNKLDEFSKSNYFVENIGSSPLPYKIETDIINSNLNIFDTILRKYSYDDLESYLPEEYEGKNFYFEIKIADKQIAEGDIVSVEYKGYYIDDSENQASLFDQGSGMFFIGSKLAIDDFENNMIGQTVGKEFSFYATFPGDYSFEELKGKKVIFYATIKSVYTAPIYNDDFIKNYFPDCSTTAEFESLIKNEYLLNELYSFVLDEAEILEYPSEEYSEIANSLEESSKTFEQYYGITIDEYIKNAYNMTRDEYIKSQMKTEMVYYAIAKSENLVVTPEMMTNERAELLDYYKELYLDQGYSEDEALDAAQTFVDEIGWNYIYENELYDMVEGFLCTIAKVNEIPKTYISISEKLAKQN